MSREIEVYKDAIATYNDKESLEFLTDKFVELNLYEGDRKKKFTNEYAKECGKDFMMLSYEYGQATSDTLIGYGQEKIRQTMEDWEKQ